MGKSHTASQGKLRICLEHPALGSFMAELKVVLEAAGSSDRHQRLGSCIQHWPLVRFQVTGPVRAEIAPLTAGGKSCLHQECLHLLPPGRKPPKVFAEATGHQIKDPFKLTEAPDCVTVLHRRGKWVNHRPSVRTSSFHYHLL